MPNAIVSCAVVNAAHAAQVKWKDGMRGEFSAVMLRDNCLCKMCRNPAAGERAKLTSSIPLDISIKSAKVQGGKVVICWDDGHISKYASEWLRRNAPLASPQEPESAPKAWTASIAKTLPRFSYKKLLADDKDLLRFLCAFRDYGVSLVQGVPLNKNEVEKFANHLAYVREIIFDRVADIRVSEDGCAQGFTGASLHPHTDCSGYRWPPNVFLFHCLENKVEGGENIYVDGQAVIEQMRDEHLDYLHFLTKIRTTFRLFSKNTDTTTTAPPVILDERGNLGIIRYANWAVQPIRMPLFDTEYYYAAHSALSRLINAPENQLVIKVKPGEMMVVNNHRVLHGRNEFRAETGGRHFQQVYMEADDLMGRIRVLHRQIGALS